MLQNTKKYRNPIGTYDTTYGFNIIAAAAAHHQWVSNWQSEPVYPMNPSLVDSGHNGTGFVTFHRQLSIAFEQEMHANGWPFELGLPYWNITIQDQVYWDTIYSANGVGSNGDPATAPQYLVRDGPMAYQTIYNGDGTLYPYPLNMFSRNVDFTLGGIIPGGKVLTYNQTYGLLAYDVFDAEPFSGGGDTPGFRHVLENNEHTAINWTSLTFNDGKSFGPHNWAHSVNGGQMGPPIGPYDPVFFLHHNFVDHLFDEWIKAHPDASYPIAETFHNHFIDAADYGPLGCVHVYPPVQHQDLFVPVTALGYSYEFADLSGLSSSSSSSSSVGKGVVVASIAVVLFLIVVVTPLMYWKLHAGKTESDLSASLNAGNPSSSSAPRKSSTDAL